MSLCENIIFVLCIVWFNWFCVIFILMIIVFGIMAFVGIFIVIDVGINFLSDNFFNFGVNIFDIEFCGEGVWGYCGGRCEKIGEFIFYDQVLVFKEVYDFLAWVFVFLFCLGIVIIKCVDEKMNFNVGFFGIDENYLEFKGFELAVGWNFIYLEFICGGFIVIIGFEIVDELFKG